MPTKLCIDCHRPSSYRGRCRIHQRQRDRDTHPNKQVYSSARWRNTRKRQLFLHPLCQCQDGCDDLATDVDHITPIEDGGAVWDFDNLQSLSASHHGQKTRREQQGATR